MRRARLHLMEAVSCRPIGIDADQRGRHAAQRPGPTQPDLRLLQSPETNLADITAAQAQGPVPAEVTIGDHPTPRFFGTLTYFNNSVDCTTGTITARATIANPGQSVVPGQYVHIRLRVGKQADALLVPQVAVGSSQLGRFVYVVGTDHKAKPHLVTLGRTIGQLVIVEKGMAEGESVIVGNLQKPGPGAPVAPEPAQGSGGA
jgi:multidrug efflux system membrane fusion protein